MEDKNTGADVSVYYNLHDKEPQELVSFISGVLSHEAEKRATKVFKKYSKASDYNGMEMTCFINDIDLIAKINNVSVESLTDDYYNAPIG